MASTYDAPNDKSSADAGKNYTPRSGSYSLSCPAEELYEHLARDRQSVIDTGREMARLTIPSVFPPDGYRTGDRISKNEQSFGALAVNTLASKLMFLALSPHKPMLRFQVIEHRMQAEIDKEPQLWSIVQAGLSQLEIKHRDRMEATTMRSAYVGAVKGLLVGGNICWEHLEINNPMYHLPTCYVVKRSKNGQPLLTIVQQETDVADLDEDHQDFIYSMKPDLKRAKEYERKVTIYKVCKRVQKNGTFYWEYWEEFEGHVLDDTEFTSDFDTPPLYPAWMVPVYGDNWGRSYCEEYRGDLYKVEALEGALNDASAAASLLLLFLNPGARTTVRQLKQAENMSVLSGKEGDLTSFKLDKVGDFRFVLENAERTAQRLGRAFLLISAIQRQAERVTAEEWERMAQEVEEAMGGLYSELGQSFQNHVVKRFVVLHYDDDKNLPKVPEDYIRVAPVSAMSAFGRSQEGAALVRATATIGEIFGPAGLKYVRPLDFTRRVYASEAVPQAGLVIDEEEVQAGEEKLKRDAMQAEVLSKAAGPIASGITPVATEMAANQATQAAQETPQEDEGAPPTPPL